MSPEHLYRTRLQTTIETLRYWVPGVADAARVDESEADGLWQLSVVPHTAGACAFRLCLLPNQTFELTVGGERYMGQPVTSLDLFVPLAEAIAAGDVRQLLWSSSNTGALFRIETIIDMAGGRHWTAFRDITQPPPPDLTVVSERRFLAYRR